MADEKKNAEVKEEEKLSFIEKIKKFFKGIAEENRNLKTTTARINSSGLCGAINRGVKNGDFWNGSYVSIEADHGVIYGSNQDDYTFEGSDVAGFEVSPATNVKVSVGDKNYTALRYTITFKDGKTAIADIITDKLNYFKTTLGL